MGFWFHGEKSGKWVCLIKSRISFVELAKELSQQQLYYKRRHAFMIHLVLCVEINKKLWITPCWAVDGQRKFGHNGLRWGC